MTQDAPPSQGLVAGKYELLRLIGRGGMGSVWEGRHTSLGTQVAIKFIEKEYADNEEARKRFDTEAHAAAKLQSKHAIQIYDHGVTGDGKPYIVMEMLVGEPLDKRLERQRVLALQETAHIVQQVCRALQKAHDAGIVHRDLKPENVFIVRDEDGGDEIAKVLDFGIAKIRNAPQDQSVSANTRTGAVLGTPFYMSPEQARGLRDIDHRTDLWSLGVIAFKCATGRLPFEGESLGDLLVKICTAPMPIPSQVNPQLPPSFDAWFSRALDREPARRFGTANELGDALAYAAGLSVRRPGGISNPNPTPPTPYTPAQLPGTGTALGTPNAYGAVQPYGYNATPPPYVQQPYPGNVTSAPFVASASTSSGGGGRGLIVALLIMMIVGGLAVGGFAVMRSRTTQDATSSPATTTTPTATSPPPNVTITPLLTSTVANTVPTETAPHSTTSNNHAPIPTTHNTVGTHPTNTSGAPTNTVVTPPPTNAVVYTPTPTAHPTATGHGDFGAGF
jgi:serine/threonine-protein kinase